ncbi:MAG: carbonic anhydrase [Bdellovibrionales bacterium]|nr:carbonic anhydrase [Bdellovibrionales bacterium]
MKKLIRGIVEFRQKVRPSFQEKFAKLALGQSPDTLFIACSDSRVAVNVFASTDPGDLFVVRNVGNMVPCCGDDGHSVADESEAAALEFALMNLKVGDIVVCGHSECGAMQALVGGREKVSATNLKAWLRHGEPALTREGATNAELSRVNQVSQLNVLQQLENLRSYPLVRERIAAGKLKLHGWWFELKTAQVYAYEESDGSFVVIDESEATRILERLESS